ncbi:uncharacterized protein LOC112455379 [Temnothorax curvispinosus]|uniref:Uncharacterized protein LOC112455379 n=1 Tax=Temnothorax curvispinosus TaxID=300111 RepID=A0A6J1PW33_9HYME|nr:uncharacterized protein LOC112455379 [Temnothorax curvispinosus]
MLRQGKVCECRGVDMARVFHDCRNDLELENDSNDNAGTAISEYCLGRSCTLQRPSSVVQRRPPRHLLEAWYFWLGIALLVVSVIFSVSIYLGILFGGRNALVNDNRRNDRELNQPRANQNQISISIIPSTFSSQRKMLVRGAQPSFTHMSKKSNVFFVYVHR